MPIYEFVCEHCGNEFEKIVSFSATSTPPCPSCEATDVNRRVSRPAIHFKGSGWYITDSKTSNGKNGADKSKSAEGESKTESSASESSASESSKVEASKSESGESKSETKATVKSENTSSSE